MILGKKYIEWRKGVNEYTELYFTRDHHERCDDPFISDKLATYYKKLEQDDDEDNISYLSALF